MNLPPSDRDLYWRRRLRRLRLDAEPLEVQVARYRRATVVLTAIASGLGLFFLAIFAGFGRPDVGLAVVGVLVGPIVGWSWIDFAILKSRASAYLSELEHADEPSA